MKPITEFEILHHGYSKTFKGAGTAFSKFQCCVTAHGRWVTEAFARAKEQIELLGWDVSKIDLCKGKCFTPGPNKGQDGEQYYLSIRWK